MPANLIERRQYRRASLPVEVQLRGIEKPAGPSASSSPAAPLVGKAENVSLAGVYALVPAPCQLSPGSVVSFSVEIPEEFRKQFPFVRLLGKGWIVRLVPDEKTAGNGVEAVGVAVAFTGDLTALSAIQAY